MGRTVDLPEALYCKVAEYAAERHQEPDALILSWIADAMRRAESHSPSVPVDLVPDEPLSLLAGIINLPDADAGDDHDMYFGAEDNDAKK